MKEYIFESPVREVKFEKISNKKYNVYTSESCFGYNWEPFATIEIVVSDIKDYSLIDDIQEGIIRNFFYYENSFSDEKSKGFYLMYNWKNYSSSFSVETVELDDGKYYFPIEDEKNNSLILKIERVDN